MRIMYLERNCCARDSCFNLYIPRIDTPRHAYMGLRKLKMLILKTICIVLQVIAIVIPIIFILGFFIWKRMSRDLHHSILGTYSFCSPHSILVLLYLCLSIYKLLGLDCHRMLILCLNCFHTINSVIIMD